MISIGYWSVSDEDFAKIIENEGVSVDEFNKEEFDNIMKESLCDPSVGGGDPWRMGMKFHLERTLKRMREDGSLRKEQSEWFLTADIMIGILHPYAIQEILYWVV